jgi:GTP-dependent phosphoenolpyruvate carboxykinase
VSHTVSIEIEVTDLHALGKAAEDCGLTLALGQETYRKYQRSTPGECTHAIGDPAATRTYEVGIMEVGCEEKGARYELMWDPYNGGYGLMDHVGEGACKLRQAYAVRVAEKQARKEGWEVNLKKQDNGDVVLELRQEVGAGAQQYGAAAQAGRNW